MRTPQPQWSWPDTTATPRTVPENPSSWTCINTTIIPEFSSHIQSLSSKSNLEIRSYEDLLFRCESLIANMCTVPLSLDTQRNEESWLKLILEMLNRADVSYKSCNYSLDDSRDSFILQTNDYNSNPVFFWSPIEHCKAHCDTQVLKMAHSAGKLHRTLLQFLCKLEKPRDAIGGDRLTEPKSRCSISRVSRVTCLHKAHVCIYTASYIISQPSIMWPVMPLSGQQASSNRLLADHRLLITVNYAAFPSSSSAFSLREVGCHGVSLFPIFTCPNILIFAFWCSPWCFCLCTAFLTLYRFFSSPPMSLCACMPTSQRFPAVWLYSS